jgi:S1-C subfamily serine protease
MNDEYPSDEWRPIVDRPVPAPVPRPQRATVPTSTRRRKVLPLGAILGILMALVLAGGGVLNQAADAATNLLGSQTATPTAVTAQTTGSATDQTVAQVAAAANPTVVTVTTIGQAPAQSQTGLPSFGQSQSGTEQPLAKGSGFIWDANGHVITNAHVVAGGDQFTVTFSDGTTVDATLVGKDVFADVAVLQVELKSGGKLPGVATIGDSAGVASGETVIAIGSPYGELTNTVSEGIVGATGRTLPSSAGTYDLTDLIQHDAAIYPGNSGGPLLNLAGQVIGINVATLQDTQTGQASGIGFAISIDSVRDLITGIIQNGSVDRPYLGIQSQVTQSGGQGVVDVDSSGPSANVLKPGDLITAVDGTDIGLDTPFLNQLFTHKPGDTVKLKIERNGKTQTVSVKLASRPADPTA